MCSFCEKIELTAQYDSKFVLFLPLNPHRSQSCYLAIKISNTVFQMKMEDMPLSGPDNTKLEVRHYLQYVLNVILMSASWGQLLGLCDPTLQLS